MSSARLALTYCAGSDSVAANRTDLIFKMIRNAAPERVEALDRFRTDYPIRFIEADDRTGIRLNADRHRVEYARKDLQIIWLVGFSLWKSIEVYAPSVMISRSSDGASSLVSDVDIDIDLLERDYRERIAAIRAIIDERGVDDRLWPPDIPVPFESREDAVSIEDAACFDLVNLATAAAFLHELRNVIFDADANNGIARPSNRAEEELQCDVWARDWLFSKLAHFAEVNGHSYVEICSKRAIAMLIVCEFLRLAAPGFGAADYPPIAERIQALSENMQLPENDKYWLIASCVLAGDARRQGLTSLEIPSGSYKSLAEQLTGLLEGE